jgi:NAD(P)-dependent dehydrogenase (short-subunit alcohol dehydrogenase family)
MSLTGKTAVVTGAGRGIGHAYCLRLAADGANVVAVDINDPTDSLAALSGDGEKVGLVCDISQPEQIDSVEKAVTERFGRCDILVNNAAIFPYTSLDTVTSEVWRKVQATNVEAMVLFAKAFVPGMRAAGWGRIVNTGSSITLGQARNVLAYSTSKGSVHALTRALANELGDSGVTVNAIAPSMVPTEGLLARPVADAGVTNEEQVAHVASLQTITRPR